MPLFCFLRIFLLEYLHVFTQKIHFMYARITMIIKINIMLRHTNSILESSHKLVPLICLLVSTF